LESHVLSFFARECGNVPDDELVARQTPPRARRCTLIRAGKLVRHFDAGHDHFDVRVRYTGREQHLAHRLR